MPPGFISAITGWFAVDPLAPASIVVGSATCPSAIRSPSGDSPSASWVREISVPSAMCPITLFAMADTNVLYVSMIDWTFASGETDSSLVAIRFSAKAAGRTMSCVFRSMSRCSLVTIRPNENALVNSRGWPFGSWTTQL